MPSSRYLIRQQKKLKKELRTIVILNSFYVFSTFASLLASSELRWTLAVAVFEILS